MAAPPICGALHRHWQWPLTETPAREEPESATNTAACYNLQTVPYYAVAGARVG